MAADTTIEWTEKTWNPGRGCSRVSPGCDECYAMKIAYRFSGPGLAYEGLATLRKNKADWTGIVREIPEALVEPLRWRDPKLVFVDSQTDLFHHGYSNEFIAAVFGVMAATPHHRYQILTKRADRMREWFQWVAEQWPNPYEFCEDRALEKLKAAGVDTGGGFVAGCDHWPLDNVILGVSVESQKYADERIPHLLATPAIARMVSVEPQLALVNLRHLDAEAAGHTDFHVIDALTGKQTDMGRPCPDAPSKLDWVVDGGESASKRPFDLDWALLLINQCAETGTPFFMKQYGSTPMREGVRVKLTGKKRRKGGDMSQWDEVFRVRQYPSGFAPVPVEPKEIHIAIPLARRFDPERHFMVLRARPGNPDAEKDAIWNFEADGHAAAREFMIKWIPGSQLSLCEVVKVVAPDES